MATDLQRLQHHPLEAETRADKAFGLQIERLLARIDNPARNRPEVLLAAKTYAKDTLKCGLSVGFCIFEGQSSVSPKTMRRCMKYNAEHF